MGIFRTPPCLPFRRPTELVERPSSARRSIPCLHRRRPQAQKGPTHILHHRFLGHAVGGACMVLAWHSTRTRRGMLKYLWARADNLSSASSPKTAVSDWRVGRQALSSKRYYLRSTRNRGGVVRTVLVRTRFIRTTYYGNRGWTVRSCARVSFYLHIPCFSTLSRACIAHVVVPQMSDTV